RAMAVLRGQRRLSTADFHNDYEPLLSGNGWLSRWIVSLAEAARSLDEAELRALPALLEEGIVRELAANWLLILKEDPQQSVDHLVARMLNAAWNLGLRDLVAARLKMLEPQVAAKPAVGWSKLSPEELDKRLKADGPRNAGATDPN